MDLATQLQRHQELLVQTGDMVVELTRRLDVQEMTISVLSNFILNTLEDLSPGLKNTLTQSIDGSHTTVKDNAIAQEALAKISSFLV